MNKKVLCFILFIVLLIMPFATYALEDKNENFKLVSESTKYYKTVEFVGNTSTMSLNQASPILFKTFEISKEEYDLADMNTISPLQSTVINTEYKQMTTSILKNGSSYRYSNKVYWKKTPSVRSYDIIGIGFYENVKVNSNINFKLTYTNSSGTTSSSTTNYPQTFSTGVGTTFKVPTGDIKDITATIYFDVAKNTSSKIYAQEIFGDYSHAVKSITLANAKKYNVNNKGIVLNSSISDYYDSINFAKVVYDGTW